MECSWDEIQLIGNNLYDALRNLRRDILIFLVQSVAIS